jgi:hypothetical protein
MVAPPVRRLEQPVMVVSALPGGFTRDDLDAPFEFLEGAQRQGLESVDRLDKEQINPRAGIVSEQLLASDHGVTGIIAFAQKCDEAQAFGQWAHFLIITNDPLLDGGTGGLHGGPLCLWIFEEVCLVCPCLGTIEDGMGELKGLELAGGRRLRGGLLIDKREMGDRRCFLGIHEAWAIAVRRRGLLKIQWATYGASFQ